MKQWLLSTGSLLAGLAALAQQPASQPTNLSFYNVKPYAFNLSFTASSAAGYLVVRSVNPITFTPQDGVEYQKGQGVAPGVKVFSVGATTSATIKETVVEQTYYFAVFAYNGSGSGIDYKNTDPLTGNMTTPAGGPGNYFNSVNGQSPTFLTDLKTRLNTGRVFQSYVAYRDNMMPNVYIRDTVGGMQVTQCQYTGEIKTFTPPFAFGTSGNDYSKEHCLPQSWMCTVNNTTSDQDRADYHNLIPVNQNKANNKRSNYPYGIVQTVTDQYLEGKLGTNNQGITVYEPRDEVKGDVARGQFYMMVCYNGNSGTWGYQTMPTYAPQQNQDLLKTWHIQDPPSAFERTRHEYVYSLQFNRNPFIDYPDLVDCINFNTLTLYNNCAITMGNEEQQLTAAPVTVFPNPVDGTQDFTVRSDEAKPIARVSVIDIKGSTVYQQTPLNQTSVTVAASGFVSGIYFVQVILADGRIASHKIVINH